MNVEVTEHQHTGLRAMPRGVWALGFEAETEEEDIMCPEAVPWRCHRSLVADPTRRDGRAAASA